MEYTDVRAATFLERPNRFVAYVELEGRRQICHVKNTGRCKELLVPGCRVYLQKAQNPARHTPYDLIAVEKGDRLINMDSAAPNQIFAEWAAQGYFGPAPLVRREVTHGDSRFDFYIEAEGRSLFAEVKGCTLEMDGRCYFPDAPTQRGVKHLNGLCRCVEEGYEAYAVFIIQMEDVLSFAPNDVTHPAFGQALRRCRQAGVHILALDCAVTPSTIRARRFVPLAF